MTVYSMEGRTETAGPHDRSEGRGVRIALEAPSPQGQFYSVLVMGLLWSGERQKEIYMVEYRIG
jgi:hypothetical protein